MQTYFWYDAESVEWMVGSIEETDSGDAVEMICSAPTYEDAVAAWVESTTDPDPDPSDEAPVEVSEKNSETDDEKVAA